MHAQRLMLAAGCAIAMFAVPALAVAQTVAAPPAAKPAAGASGVKSYETGAKAFEAGKYGPAIQSLTAAIGAGGLSSQQMAKALYYRGVAYRKTGKTAQAISDLTSAVWLKNGLNDSDRAAAMDQRQGAYQEAGLGDGVPVGAAPLDAPAAPAAVAESAPAPAAVDTPAPSLSAGPAEPATSSWAATSAKGAAAASVPQLAQPSTPPADPVPSGGFATIPTSEPNAPTLSALPQGDAGAAPEAALLDGVGSTIGNAGTTVGNFFGNMFSGLGSGATAEPSGSVTTSATDPPPAPAQAAAATTLDWGSGTSVVEGKAKKTAASGKFRLQVGVVRSRAEAEQMAASLKAQHGATLGTAVPVIDEVVYGNMGTFYRVQVGPYASAAEPGQFCTALKPQGYDCMVITQ